LGFLVDAQLPPALARWIATSGPSAEHVFDLELASASDDAIWQRAHDTSAVILTKDEDFSILVQLSESGPTVVWIRLGNVRTRALLDECAKHWRTVVDAIERGDRLVEMA
jgi:predicted nuclease of predicted toxin-antitoxin system